MPRRPKTKLHPHNRWFFAAGIFFLLLFYLYQLHLAVRLSFTSSPPAQPTLQASAPTAISIPAIKLNLPVFPTIINNNTWTIAPQGVSFLAQSARPGTPGPIILYSHNTNSRFGPIRWLALGDKITLTTANNLLHSYQVTQTLTVAPSQIQALAATQETLILYTCTGFFDKDRFIVRATPISP